MKGHQRPARTKHKAFGVDHDGVLCDEDDVWPREIWGAWEEVTCPDCLRLGRERGYWKGEASK